MILPWCVQRGVGAIANGHGDAALAGTITFGLDSARARKIQADAQLAELKYALESGRAVSIDAVTADLARRIAGCRGRLLAIPSKVGPLLAADDSASGCQAIVEREIFDALAELANGDFSASRT